MVVRVVESKSCRVLQNVVKSLEFEHHSNSNKLPTNIPHGGVVWSVLPVKTTTPTSGRWTAGRTRVREVRPVRKSLQRLQKDVIMTWTRMGQWGNGRVIIFATASGKWWWIISHIWGKDGNRSVLKTEPRNGIFLRWCHYWPESASSERWFVGRWGEDGKFCFSSERFELPVSQSERYGAAPSSSCARGLDLYT